MKGWWGDFFVFDTDGERSTAALGWFLVGREGGAVSVVLKRRGPVGVCWPAGSDSPSSVV